MYKSAGYALLVTSLLFVSHYSSASPYPSWAIPMKNLNASFAGDEFYAGKVGDSYMVSSSFWHALAGSNVDLDGKINQYVLDALLSASTLPDHNSVATTVGWTTGSVLNGNPSPLDQYLLDGPEVSLVMFGTSDIGLANPTLFESNLNQIIDELFAANSIPVLNTLPPQVGRLTEVDQYNTIIRNVADARNVPVADLYTEVIARQPELWGSTLLAGDGIHLSGCSNTAHFTDSNLNTCGYALMNYVNLKVYSEIYHRVLASTDIVTTGGKEWLNPDLFLDLTWEEVINFCPAGVCGNGLFNGYDLSGWFLADMEDINQLFDSYVNDPQFPPPSGLTQWSYSECFSSWAPAFFNDGWRPTYITESAFNIDAYIYGTYTGTLNLPGLASFRDDTLETSCFLDMAQTVSAISPPAPPQTISGTGAWFYKPIPPGC